MEYLVRQYRPAYCSGFTNQIFKAASKDDILSAPWLKNFKQKNFDKFSIEDYSNDELIISAKYKQGESWVSAFAIPITSAFANDWRYKEHES